jgi:hypothetical protein
MAKSKALAQIDAVLKKSGGNKKEKGGGARKYGRQTKSPAMARYRAESRWETNKVAKVRRHLLRSKFQRNDVQARAWYAAFGGRDAQAFLAALPLRSRASVAA